MCSHVYEVKTRRKMEMFIWKNKKDINIDSKSAAKPGKKKIETSNRSEAVRNHMQNVCAANIQEF